MKPLVVAWLLVFSTGIHARYLSYKHFTTAHGVPHSVVFRGFQDPRGFLWFGTDAGLARFDGNHFKSCHTPRHDVGASILAIETTSPQKLVVASYKDGLYHININSPDSLRSFPVINTTALPKRIIQLIQHQNYLWFIAMGGKAGYIYNGSCYLLKFNVYIEKLRVIGNELYACTRGGLYVWNKETFRLVAFPGKPVYDIAHNGHGTFWIGSRAKIIRCTSKDTFTYLLHASEEIHQLLCDRTGKIWFTGNKQSLYYIEQDKITPVPALLGIRQFMCNQLFEDRDGNIWVATYGDGIYCFYYRFIASSQSGNGLSDQFIKCITEEPDGNTYVGTFTSGHINTGQRFRQLPFRLLPDAPFRSIAHWNNKYVAGTYQQVVVAGHGFGKQQHYNISGTALYTRDTHILYIGSYGSVYLLHRNGRLEKSAMKSESQMVNRIIKDYNNIYWLATDSGLAFTHNFKQYGYLYTTHGLASNKVNDLCLDKAGRMWVATSLGLQLWQKGKFITTLNTTNGLAHNNCIALTRGRKNELWVATEKGVNCLNGGSIYHIGTSQGLPADEVTCLLYSSSGDLWVGTVNGISRIDLREMALHTSSYKPAISEIRMPGGVVFAAEDSLYQLAPAQRNFTALLTSFDYIHSNAITYAYRLNGQPWQETQNAQIDFANISPGDYVLQVRAQNRFTGWSEHFSWRFTINRPYWQTMWFVTILVSFVGICVWLFLKNRIKQVQKREREKLDMYKNMQALKQHALTTLLSPHFVFNALHSIQHFINKYDKRAANEYLADFAHLVRKTMNDAAQVFISLREELEYLELYLSLEKLRYGDKLRYQIIADDAIDSEETFLPSMLVQPYVENAIWHGLMNKKEGGLISIRITRSENYLNIVIEDDGVGIHPQQSKDQPDETPRGTAIIRKRMELLGSLAGKPVLLNITSMQNGQGTRVTIGIPNALTEQKDPFVL